MTYTLTKPGGCIRWIGTLEECREYQKESNEHFYINQPRHSAGLKKTHIMFTSIQITYGSRSGQYVLSGLDKNGKTVSTIINDAPLFDALRYESDTMPGEEAIERATAYLHKAAERRCIRSVGLAKVQPENIRG